MSELPSASVMLSHPNRRGWSQEHWLPAAPAWDGGSHHQPPPLGICWLWLLLPGNPLQAPGASQDPQDLVTRVGALQGEPAALQHHVWTGGIEACPMACSSPAPLGATRVGPTHWCVSRALFLDTCP